MYISDQHKELIFRKSLRNEWTREIITIKASMSQAAHVLQTIHHALHSHINALRNPPVSPTHHVSIVKFEAQWMSVMMHYI